MAFAIPWYPMVSPSSPLGAPRHLHWKFDQHRSGACRPVVWHAQVQLATDWPSSSLFSTQKIRNLTHLRSLSTRPTCSVRNKTQDDSSKLLKGEGSTARICASVLNLATLPHLTHKISPATSRTPFHNHVQSSNMFKICPELSGVGARSLGSGTWRSVVALTGRPAWFAVSEHVEPAWHGIALRACKDWHWEMMNAWAVRHVLHPISISISQTSHDILHDHPSRHRAPRPSRPIDLVNEPLPHGGIPHSHRQVWAETAGTTCYNVVLYIYCIYIYTCTWWRNAGEKDWEELLVVLETNADSQLFTSFVNNER